MALAGALKHGELGLAYPLMRGTAPLLVALGSYFLLDEAIAAWGWLGIVLISSGVLMLGVSAGLLHHRKAVLFALSNAVLIALYTVVDAQGARESGQVAQYIALLFALDGWPFALLVFLRRKGQVWTYVRALAAGHGRRGRLSGLVCDCPVGHDGGPGGPGGVSARNLGALFRRFGGLAAQRTLDTLAYPGGRKYRGGRDRPAAGIAIKTRSL